MSNTRRASLASRQQRLIDALRADNARKAALFAELTAPPHFVPVKAAEARGYSAETVRRWCHRNLVKHRWDGTRLLVDQNDLTARCNRLTGNH
jgi:hypothetical protein